MTEYSQWLPDDAARHIRRPTETDDKYSRGVLGVITGSDQYPGAAVLGVEAALRTGVGMVRYIGGERVSTLVLQRRPEAVTSQGRVQAWVIGSGMDHDTIAAGAGADTTLALAQSLPTVLDGGAIGLHAEASGPVVVTPHHGELARLLGVDRAEIAADPGRWAERAADELGVTVFLKGHRSFVAGGGQRLMAASAPSWLATAGSGDALAGILGALVASHAEQVAADQATLPRLAATAAVLHGLAGHRASAGGPLTILDLARALPATIAALLA
jgi:hydroxyethylthiazole kinase-like uncharacterized protein yjeF